MDGYDKWKLATPDENEKIAFSCEECKEPIFVGEEYVYIPSDGNVHVECFYEFCKKILDARHKNAEWEVHYDY